MFMHGLFGSRKNDRSMSKYLANDLNRPVYAVDLRNHGDSPHHPQHDYVELADDVTAFIHEHDIQQPSLIGHSIGAKTALRLSLRCPELVSDIVAVDNAPVNLPLLEDFPIYIAGMKHVQAAKIHTTSAADAIPEEYEQSPSIRLFLLTNLIRSPNSPHMGFRIPLDTLASSFKALGDFPFDAIKVDKFDKPTLFIRATRSHYINNEAIPLIKRLFPRADMVDVDCGHWVITERPADFRRLLAVEEIHYDKTLCTVLTGLE